jgi:hypothetical protein
LEGDGYRADPWLEALDDKGVARRAEFVDSYAEEWFRVRHSLLATAELIAQRATEIAPTFVSEQGEIAIEILPIAAWASQPARLRVRFVDQNLVWHDIDVLGAGTARWVAASVRLACQELATASRVVIDAERKLVTNPDEANRIIKEAENDRTIPSCFRFDPVPTYAIYLVDEPEAHLHPKAVTSVTQWLIKLAESASGVAVATHNTTVLDAPSETATRVLVRPGPRGAELRPLTGSLATALQEFAPELGLTQGELLLHTRLALFVEGPHDLAVLEEWFGPDLRSAGVRMFPVHGIRNASALVNSEIIAALGLKTAILADNASIDKILRGGQPGSSEERTILRLLAEAKRANRLIRAYGLDERDIVYYLEDAVCQAAAPKFPGWQRADKEWKAAGRSPDIKKWVFDKYQLRLNREEVRTLARASTVHPEVSPVIHEILGYADRSEVDK